MYPNDSSELPQPQQEYSIDYLNQISGGYKPPSSGPSKIVLIIAGAVGVISLLIFAMLIFSSGPSAGDKAADVYLRLQTLESLTSDNKKELRNNDLRSINSGLNLQLSNVISDMEEPLSSVNVNPKTLSKTRKSEETTYKTTIQEGFDDAVLNVQLDSIYTREMSYQLATLRSMIQSTYRATNSKSLKEFLISADEQLAPFTDKLSAFSDS